MFDKLKKYPGVKSDPSPMMCVYAGPEYFEKLATQARIDKEIAEKDTNITSEVTSCLDDIWEEMYKAAQAVQNERKISDYVEAGGVAAAIYSASGKIYTGVCIDTCSTLGICAERNAIFNMITNGEQEFTRVLAIMPDGKGGAPCGACRELMVQLMPEKYKDVQILMDYESQRIVKLGDITPEWWI